MASHLTPEPARRQAQAMPPGMHKPVPQPPQSTLTDPIDAAAAEPVPHEHLPSRSDDN
jgi:hypothetical protein